LNLIRDYLLEEDVFEALYQLHKQFYKAKNSIYNISSGEGINLRFLTQEIVAASNSDIKIQETNLDFQPDIKTSIGDNSKIKEILDLDLNIDLIQIINQLQKF
jgi:UDP-glucose 4-epimerase